MKHFLTAIFLCLISHLAGLAQTANAPSHLLRAENISTPKADSSVPVYADIIQASTAGSDRVTIPAKQYYHTSYVGGLVFLGAVALLMFFVLILYARSRDHIYLYYFLFLALSFAGAWLNTSLYQWQEWSYRPGDSASRKSLETATLLALSAYCLFTLRLLEVKQQNERLHRWILTLASINAAYGVSYWFAFPYISQYEDLLFITSRSIILPMSLVAIVWVNNKIHSPFKGYFIIGSAFYFMGALLAVLRQETGAIPFRSFYNIASTFYFQAGIFLEIVAFALALTHRIYLLNKVREQQQEKIRLKAIFERDQAMAGVLAARMQSNPHLIFNSLSAINYLIQSNQNAKAMKALNLYSRFVRKVLETGQRPLITLSEELQIVRHYIQQELIRYDQPFTYSITTDPGINKERIMVPPMLLMAFTEEIVWQRLSEKSHSDQVLSVSVTGSQKRVQIALESGAATAVGVLTKSRLDADGWQQLNNERIELFNKSHQRKIHSYAEENSTPAGINKKFVLVIEEKHVPQARPTIRDNV